MKNLKLIGLSLIMVCSYQASAQFGYYQDALKYSQTNSLIGSTARMQGIAGAQTSLGGDMSHAGSNPAGLGFFTKSSATFTLGLGFNNSDDSFAGVTTPNFQNTFGIANAGFVTNYGKGRFSEEKFKGGSLGISLSKINDFNREYRYEGESGTSLLDVVIGNFNNQNDGDLENAFYNQFLVDEVYYNSSDPEGSDNFHVNNGVISPNQVGDASDYQSVITTVPYQQETISERGGQYQINVAWGGNYDDKFYFGGGVGIQTLYFKRDREYSETEFIDGDGNLDPYFDGFMLDDNLVARGAGINTSFGAILRPVQALTIGISYQSPTFMTINEESDFSLTTDWLDYGYEDLNNEGDIYDLQGMDPYLSAVTETKYKLKTPSKLNLGATFFLGKLGFISGDVEMIDYSNAELQADFSVLDDNQVIRDSYKSVMNYRLGAEFRMDNLRFRGGVAQYPDPSDLGFDRDYFTLGVGIRTNDYFVDLAVVNTNSQAIYQPFAIDGLDTSVTSDLRSTNVTISAGFNF